MVGEPVDALAGFLGVYAHEFGVGTIARQLHHVAEEGFFVVFGMVLLETASDRRNPARGIDGRAVGAAHLFEQNGLRTLFRGFERRAHAGKARAHYDDVVNLILFLRVRFLWLRFHRADRSGHRGARREPRLQKVSALQAHKGLLRFWKSPDRGRSAHDLRCLSTPYKNARIRCIREHST